MNTQEKIEVMKAYAEGKTIQVREVNDKEWADWVISIEPEWDWVAADYRIKPEEKYRPYKDTEEMIEDFRKKVGMGYPKLFLPSVWVKKKADGSRKLVTEFGFTCVWLSVDPVGITMSKLSQDYTYLDGSPCGMKEE